MNTSTSSSPAPFVGYISLWKVVGVTALVSLVAVCPMLPGFGNGLTYTAIFYTKWGYPVLVAACLVLLLLVVLQLPLVFRALLDLPAIEITPETVRIWGLKWREYPLSCLAGGTRRLFGSIIVRCPDGKQFTIPIWIYRNPQAVLERLLAGRAPRSATAAS